MSTPRILIVQPSVQPPGGGNGVCAWMLQALRHHYRLSLLTWEPVDLPSINAYFGTSLRPDDFELLGVPAWLRALGDRLPVPAATLKASVLRRRVKRLRDRWDLAMSANNEADFGRPGIQYVHYPVRHIAPLPVDLRWYHAGWALAAYGRLWAIAAPFDDESMRANLTLVNSEWTGALVTATHRMPVRVVHPPAPGRFPDVPWSDREDGFLCIGRLSPEKGIERIIEIVGRVRQQRPAAHLHIVGGDDHVDYARRIRELARGAGDWVTVEGTVPMERLQSLLSGHRYVVHAMPEEHFGMSIAQAVRAGCIPFVPDGGGQVEIVGNEPRLRYRSADDAVGKILAVSADDALQTALRRQLAVRATAFSAERFMDDIRRAAAEMLARQRQAQ